MSSKPEILVVSEIPQPMIDTLECHFAVHKFWLQEGDAFLNAHGGRIRGALVRAAKGISTALVNKLPALEAVSSFGVGLDALNLPLLRERHIHVSNTPDVLNECVADTALALMLAVTRKICLADRFARAGKWQLEAFPGAWKMSGKRCGIVGMGSIGHEVAKRATAFNMPIHYFSRRKNGQADWQHHDALIELAKAVDFLVLTLPGGEATQHIINREVLEALGPEGIVINIARGSVLDTDALVTLLQEGKLRGAGLDVFEQEPQIPAALCALDNVVLLPHIGSNTAETRQAMADLTITNLVHYFQHGSMITPA
ncbi:hydroxyacid dehydrogenase [Superficieibacter electus]|uniref:Hydroxyacid dehydrogenase n=1 Tax=Superficieibacter electus TaxID=2022662 RepID=A0A2P5GSE5_9ENTR|nr:2-hydroxyacid dehydrogenase [Superficieibacter electus]POP46720.1 hydroxyacid dehydrogenase [Superficieibacter electus]POP49458.1 hydroxyacid dehydrogenase [Superficieibacter electus]